MDTHLGRAVLVVHDFVGGGRPMGETLEEIARLATAAIDTNMAGLTLNDDRGRATTAVATDRAVQEIDQAQYDADDGPCFRAFRTSEVTRLDDIDRDDRWPAFCEAAAGHGVRSSLSVPVVVGDGAIGALNFYDRAPRRFDDEMVATARLFAGHVALVAAFYEKADTADNLRVAIESRADIEQAKGIIMATTGCSPDDAFAILRQQSQNENRKLRDIAAEIVALQQLRSRA